MRHFVAYPSGGLAPLALHRLRHYAPVKLLAAVLTARLAIFNKKKP